MFSSSSSLEIMLSVSILCASEIGYAKGAWVEGWLVENHLQRFVVSLLSQSIPKWHSVVVDV